MIDIFNTIKLGNNELYRGNDFTLQREYIYAGEYETCTGRRIADIVGWRYSDLTISWDNLPADQFAFVLGLTGQRVYLRFDNEQGTYVSEYVIPQVISSQATRYTNPYDGSVVWKNVQLQIKFVNSHTV